MSWKVVEDAPLKVVEIPGKPTEMFYMNREQFSWGGLLDCDVKLTMMIGPWLRVEAQNNVPTHTLAA